MSVPERTQVLVIGGGPAGSYPASALAREGIEAVVLEGDKFPRYHVGESMLPSLRQFFRFINLDDTFIGAAFVLTNKDPACEHAGKSGAKIFDGVKVSAIKFAPHDGPSSVKFDYVVGLMSTKCLKNHHFNQGTPQEGVPYFEALSDGSGWVWFIPLHNNTVSVGVVINQEVATRKKEMGSPGRKAFYLEMLKALPRILGPMLKDTTLVTEIKAASDWSYSASSYASYNARIVGDTGCFIDPFFSSGVHLAVASGLSAAANICASIKGQVTECEALEWHSKKVAEGYTRFLLIVLSALKQIRGHDQAILSDWDEEGFERAFAHFRPIIQATAYVHGKLTQEEVAKTVDFCLNAFAPVDAAKRDAVMAKVEELKSSGSAQIHKELEAYLSPDELHILNTVRAREMVRSEDTVNIDTFTSDTMDGRAVNMIQGSLGLISAHEAAKNAPKKSTDLLSKMMGEEKKLAQGDQLATAAIA
ncbi:hypothetical protein EJ02DRAFT_506414 [Clathrospora elynae]|uniref:FAD/NAD(P)-binding domain-containing protein n=1 Tax=Clathrospora elynae TaxID=706981 RepID=A0A6A5SAI4_9PLEO|nr:hypothetical protein EJ02DRAFT_506414 [Clathrospora elynae]